MRIVFSFYTKWAPRERTFNGPYGPNLAGGYRGLSFFHLYQLLYVVLPTNREGRKICPVLGYFIGRSRRRLKQQENQRPCQRVPSTTTIYPSAFHIRNPFASRPSSWGTTTLALPYQWKFLEVFDNPSSKGTQRMNGRPAAGSPISNRFIGTDSKVLWRKLIIGPLSKSFPVPR